MNMLITLHNGKLNIKFNCEIFLWWNNYLIKLLLRIFGIKYILKGMKLIRAGNTKIKIQSFTFLIPFIEIKLIFLWTEIPCLVWKLCDVLKALIDILFKWISKENHKAPIKHKRFLVLFTELFKESGNLLLVTHNSN